MGSAALALAGAVRHARQEGRASVERRGEAGHVAESQIRAATVVPRYADDAIAIDGERRL